MKTVQYIIHIGTLDDVNIINVFNVYFRNTIGF